MATLRELKDRIKAVGNIKRITKTMQMIATAKFQAAVRRATETKPYTEQIAQLVGDLAAAAGSGDALAHPLLSKPDVSPKRELVLIITSNRGLCGAYNGNVVRTAAQLLKDGSDVERDIQLVGKKGIAWCRFNNYDVETAHDFGDQPTYDEVNGLATEYMARYTAGRYDAVRVVYMKFISNSRQTPEVMTLLPAEPPKAEEGATGADANALYEFSPSPEELLQSLLPITVKTRLFQAFNDAVVSEQVNRMVAMKAATDNASDMGKGLTRQFNRARQAQITTELNEVIGGAEALN